MKYYFALLVIVEINGMNSAPTSEQLTTCSCRSSLPTLQKKFLVPGGMAIGEFQYARDMGGDDTPRCDEISS